MKTLKYNTSHTGSVCAYSEAVELLVCFLEA